MARALRVALFTRWSLVFFIGARVRSLLLQLLECPACHFVVCLVPAPVVVLVGVVEVVGLIHLQWSVVCVDPCFLNTRP
jgi:hypothetical protein